MTGIEGIGCIGVEYMSRVYERMTVCEDLYHECGRGVHGLVEGRGGEGEYVRDLPPYVRSPCGLCHCQMHGTVSFLV